uniref:C2H2-type domain-containing protein n=1 Tax=Eutreptiella gymnastica TaxID=73025 RepID=A0A7S1JGB0_9EUGL
MTPTSNGISPSPPRGKEQLYEDIVRAVEYIFGDNNLPYDFFYLSQADQSQGVPMSYVLNNPMIKRLTADPLQIQEALAKSWLVQVHPLESDPTGLKVTRHVPLLPRLAVVAQATLENGIRKRLSRRTKSSADPESEGKKMVDDLACQVCGQSFETTAGLRHHCQSRAHQEMATCDLHVLQFVDGCWQPVQADTLPSPHHVDGTRISMVTFNILFDFYYQDQIFSPQRYNAVLESLCETEADIIGLQEVTPLFVEMLMQQPWLQRSYFVSEVSSVAIQPFGQVILSRIPLVSVQLYHMNKVKTALFGHLMIGAVDHAFCVCHLVSNFSAAADIHSMRQAHLDTIFWELSQRAENSFVLGDFNFGDEEGNYTIEPYRDVWKDLRGPDVGYTYDIDGNSLAKITMKEDSLSRRYDRILSHSSILRPIHIELSGTRACTVKVPAPPGPPKAHMLNLSDHYGVLCVSMLCLGHAPAPSHEPPHPTPYPPQPVHPHTSMQTYHEPPAQAHAYNSSNRAAHQHQQPHHHNGYAPPNSYTAPPSNGYPPHAGSYYQPPTPHEMHPSLHPHYAPPYTHDPHQPPYAPYQPYPQYPQPYPPHQYPQPYPPYQQDPGQYPYPDPTNPHYYQGTY